MITFDSLATHSTKIDRNDFFSHHFNPDALFRYDSNFFQLHYSPVKEELELMEAMQQLFSEENGLSHIKFYWPENQGIRPDTLDYLNQEEYGLEKLELYVLQPAEFTYQGFRSEQIKVEKVTAEQLATFKSINYIEDKKISADFAEEKQPFYDRLFKDQAINFFIAWYHGQPAGSCIVVESSEGFELDDVFTLEPYRYKGVATAIQAEVVAHALLKRKPVFLAADAEDTPKDMYKKAGFKYKGFRIGAQKVLKGDE